MGRSGCPRAAQGGSQQARGRQPDGLAGGASSPAPHGGPDVISSATTDAARAGRTRLRGCASPPRLRLFPLDGFINRGNKGNWGIVKGEKPHRWGDVCQPRRVEESHRSLSEYTEPGRAERNPGRAPHVAGTGTLPRTRESDECCGLRIHCPRAVAGRWRVPTPSPAPFVADARDDLSE